jgi:hypothetical protein
MLDGAVSAPRDSRRGHASEGAARTWVECQRAASGQRLDDAPGVWIAIHTRTSCARTRRHTLSLPRTRVSIEGHVTMQLFVREHRTMIAAPVQGDVDGIPNGSHDLGVSPMV